MFHFLLAKRPAPKLVRGMDNYDILMLVVLVGATLFGAIKGFAWQLASIASIVVSYIVAYQFREPFSESIKADPPWNRFLAMLILYVGTSLVIWMLFRMISRTIDRMRLKEFDRQIGAMFGLLKGALYCTLITLFAVTLLGPGLRESIVASHSGRYIARVLDKSQAIIPPELHEIVQPVLDKFDQQFQQAQPNPSQPWSAPWSSNSAENNPATQNWNSGFASGSGSSPGGVPAIPASASSWSGGQSNATPINQFIQQGFDQARQQVDAWGRQIDQSQDAYRQAGNAYQDVRQSASQTYQNAQRAYQNFQPSPSFNQGQTGNGSAYGTNGSAYGGSNPGGASSPQNGGWNDGGSNNTVPPWQR